MTPSFQLYPQFLTVEEVINPRKAITSFFDVFSVYSARAYINKWFKALHKQKGWKKAPGDLFYFYEQLMKLAECAWAINEQDNGGRRAILPDDLPRRELMNEAYYCAPERVNELWYYFPRSLDREEYINPYSVFENFFDFQKLPKWKSDLHGFLHIVLSTMNINEMCNAGYVSKAEKYLHKLTEACHLIEIREGKVIPLTIASSDTDTDIKINMENYIVN